MSAPIKLSTQALALTAVVMLQSGCVALRDGTQYVPPKAGEPVATLRMVEAPNTFLSIKSFNAKGCYTGATAVPKSDSGFYMQVRAEEKLVLEYSRAEGMQVCKFQIAFTPQRSAIYILEPEHWTEPRKGDLAVLGDQNVCGMEVLKVFNTVESSEPAEDGYISQGLTCGKWVEY